MKIYIIKYSAFDDINEDDRVFFNNLRDCYYVGSDYKAAMRTYKNCAKYNTDRVKFLSFDLTNLQDMANSSSVQSEAQLVHMAVKYKNYIRSVGAIRSHLIKDGKVTIVLEKEYYDCKENHDRDPKELPWTRFNIDRDTKLEVLKQLTDMWVREQGITFPFKVNFEGKAVCKYNQK